MSERPPLAFFGSPDFAVPSLEALVAAGLRPLLVVTQPPRPTGRGLTPTPTAVQAAAERLGVPVAAPERLRSDERLAAHLRDLNLEVAVVVAYGSLIPRSLLALPRRGFLNLHPSLLPRYRGASPIQAAIRNGDAETGVSLMVLDEGLDTGPIVVQTRVPIPPNATTPSLSAELAQVGARLILGHIGPYVHGERSPVPQAESRASLTKPLTREDGRIDWRLPAATIERLVRAMLPWPGAWTHLEDTTVKILEARIVPVRGTPGQVFARPPLRVGCGTDALELLTVQFPGGKPIPGSAAITGHPLLGRQLGDE